MRGVDQQVQDDLVELARQAGDRRQGGIEIGFHVGHVFDLIIGDGEGRGDRVVDIDGGHFLGVGVGKLPNRAHDLADPFDPFERLIDGSGHFLAQEFQVRGLGGRSDLRHLVAQHACRLGGLGQYSVLSQDPAQSGHGLAQESQVLADILDR